MCMTSPQSQRRLSIRTSSRDPASKVKLDASTRLDEHLHACTPTTKHRKGSETSAKNRQDARAALLSHTLVKLIGKGVVEAACVVKRMVRRQTVRVHTLVGGQGRP